MEFENKTLLVTGAASGMGLLCAQKFVEQGGSVLMADVNEAAVQEKAAEINAKAGSDRALGFACDVRDYAQVCAARDKAVEAFGSIDVLVNFAGGAETRMCGVGGEFKDIPIDVYDWGIDANLKGPIYFDHAVMEQMAKQRSGVIVHIGSITGQEGCECNVSYAAAKSALMNGVTKSIARYGAHYNVRCFCVAPGPVLTRAAMANMKTLEGRAAEPWEIVDMVLYMASSKGAFVNGATLLMDGGRDAMGRAW